jgi:S-formylglutathione hydrolase
MQPPIFCRTGSGQQEAIEMNRTASELVLGTFESRSTGTVVDYRVITPTAPDDREAFPLILHLHGAMSSSASLESAKTAYDAAWVTGVLPRAVVVCASVPTHGGFYIDYLGGPRWESLVGDELPDIVGSRFALNGRKAAIGFSMGGYGALKLGLRHPARYVAVAALCPTVFPGETRNAVPERNRLSILGELHQAMGCDDAEFTRNSVVGIARAHADRLRNEFPPLYFDCGDHDEFGLHDGADYLDDVLQQLGIPHRFRSVPGVRHADAAAESRLSDAIRFLGTYLAAR